MMVQEYENLIQALLEKGFGSVDNWFSTQEIDGLRKELLLRYENDVFRLAGIGNKFNLQKEKTIRNDKIHWLKQETENPFEVQFFKRIEAFSDYLNRTCFAGISSYEFHYAVYEPGSFYKRHSDQFNNDDCRRFSFVLYLNKSWDIDDGGELVIYTDVINSILPSAGKVVFFSSELEHEVKVSNARRLSLTGWLRTNKVF